MGVYVLNHLNNFQPAADGQIETILETLPLRGLLISLRASATAANTLPSPSQLAAMLTNIEVLLGGTTLWQTNTLDAWQLMGQLLGASPYYRGNGAADNDLVLGSMYIPFGRSWGSGKWGIPATPAGMLRLRLTVDIAVTGYDTLSIDVDGVYDDGMQMDGHLRVTTLAATAGATGDFTIDLPTGAWMNSIGVFPTTWRVTQAGANGINSAKLLRDGVEIKYPLITVQNAHQMSLLGGSDLGQLAQHVHPSDIAAAYTQFQATARPAGSMDNVQSNLFLDLDPGKDGAGMLDLRNCNRLQLRLNMGTAEALRLNVVEWWPANGQGQPALPAMM